MNSEKSVTLEMLKEAVQMPLQPSVISSAVMILLIPAEDGWDLLFEVRSETVPQPGEVSLPGGHLEPGETPEEAVVREMSEELGIPSDAVTLIGRLPQEQIIGHRLVQPFVGIVREDAVSNVICSDEVAEAFRVPLRYFLETEPDVYTYTMSMDPAPDLPPILQRHLSVERPWGRTKYWEYEGHGIWGLTARILEKYLEHLQELRG